MERFSFLPNDCLLTFIVVQITVRPLITCEEIEFVRVFEKNAALLKDLYSPGLNFGMFDVTPITISAGRCL